MNLSVIIPTYRRPDSLLRALASLREQTWPQHEVIVVDNAADPEIERLVAGVAAAAPVPVRYVPEPQLGLHNARHAGARAATGELLVFADDDATFDPAWLAAYARRFSEHAEMAAASGAIRLAWEVPPPRWLLDFIGGAKEFGLLGLRESYPDLRLDPDGVLYGGNMAIRRDVLFAVGGFNPDSFGDVWLGDGEVGLNCKLWQRGLLIGYEPAALMYHHIPPARMTVQYLCQRMANEGGCAEYAAFHDGIPGRAGLALRLGRIGLALGKLALLTAWRAIVARDRFALLRVRLGLAFHTYRLRYVLRLSHDRAFRVLVTKTDWLAGSDLRTAGDSLAGRAAGAGDVPAGRQR